LIFPKPDRQAVDILGLDVRSQRLADDSAEMFDGGVQAFEFGKIVDHLVPVARHQGVKGCLDLYNVYQVAVAVQLFAMQL
jgi:hypothetical protein